MARLVRADRQAKGSLCLCSTELLRRYKRSWIIDSFDIVEEYPGPFPYELGQIKLERSYLVDFMLKGKGVDEAPKGVLSIDPKTGVIKVHCKVDFEQYNVLMLTFQARNRSNLAVDTQLGMEVNILDINDNPPVFQRKIYQVTLHEATKQGTFVVGLLATDKDEPGTLNSIIDYKLISVTPSTKNAEFFIQDSGAISFKGCLDYEAANKYTILVEAKDRGEVVKLSSTATIIVSMLDGNNHPPVITGQMGSGKVAEGTNGTSPLTIHTTDADTRSTAAWRVRYSVKGDKSGHFSIHTDPDTNNGILTVVKPLDYEEQAERKITISVENEEPYFSCEVKERSANGLWTLITNPPTLSSRDIAIAVEDVNEPPYFPKPRSKIIMEENGAIGTFVDRVTAVDPDTTHPYTLQYSVEQDPAGWVRVNETTGEIFIKESLDRESSYVTNGTYTITVIVTEKDNPKVTSTATVQIYIEDKNDNVPMLQENMVSVCQSDGMSSTEITPNDLDGDPYSGPFSFEVIGDHKEEWNFDPSHGSTVHLVKHKSVHVGLYTLVVKISDMQGRYVLQNLTVAACDCTVSPNCLLQRNTQQKVGSGVIGTIVFVSLLSLACLLLFFTCSCGNVKSLAQVDHILEDTLLPSNIEKPGTDCMVLYVLPKEASDIQSKEAPPASNGVQKISGIQQVTSKNLSPQRSSVQTDKYLSRDRSQYYPENQQTLVWKQSLYRSDSCFQGTTLSRRSSQRRHNSYFISRSAIQSLLMQRLHSIQSIENELPDHEPHRYAFADDSENFVDLDPIDMPNNEFDPELLSGLGPAFKHLALICYPEICSTAEGMKNGIR
ncbi:cadherin-like protein 26 isoform X2 [Myxocyprinus asiaticus]|uniref:cadherin-like protein 26 isoform X2 n=1 Tax=Myxocyprinus asiaticus TaxID=70543 RepID=UPI002222EE02|nr:cadherin-like protein 26 isoform X2 [Myxocyprinus asiaticus]